MTSIKDEFLENYDSEEADEGAFSENETVGDPYLSDALEKYFGKRYEHVAQTEVYNGREAWPPFTEVLLFKVDGVLHAADGESDSWEGGWPVFDAHTIRPVREVTETVEVTKYEEVNG